MDADEDTQDEQAEPHGGVEQQGQEQEPIGRQSAGAESGLSVAKTIPRTRPAAAAPRGSPPSKSLNLLLSHPGPSPVPSRVTPNFPTELS